MKRLLASLVLLVAVSVGTGAVGHAQTDVYPPRSLTVTLDVDAVAPGDPFVVSLTGCLEGEVIDVDFVGTRRSFDCDLTAGPRALVSGDEALGGITASLTAPPTLGRFVGTVAFASGQVIDDFVLTVVDAAVGATPVNAQTPNAPESLPPLDVSESSTGFVIFFGFAVIAGIALFILRPQFA